MLVSDADLERVRQAIPEHPGLSVMGDTRFDSVIERRDGLTAPEWPKGFGEGTLFVAGSTWPQDEECIFPVLRQALDEFPELQLVLVPHEPTEEHLSHAEIFFQGIPMVRWKNRDQPPPALRILLIDTIGLDARPRKNQPYYHLLAENDEITYEAYVSEQNLILDDSNKPIKHPLINEIFSGKKGSGYFKPSN